MPNGNTVKHGWILLLFVSLYITKRSEAVLQWGKRKNIKKMMINGELVIEWKKEKAFNVKILMKILVKKSTLCYGNKNRNRDL